MNLIASSLLGDGLGLDLRSTQEAMGHERLDMTATYLSDVSHYLNRFRRPVGIADAARAGRRNDRPAARRSADACGVATRRQIAV